MTTKFIKYHSHIVGSSEVKASVERYNADAMRENSTEQAKRSNIDDFSRKGMDILLSPSETNKQAALLKLLDSTFVIKYYDQGTLVDQSIQTANAMGGPYQNPEKAVMREWEDDKVILTEQQKVAVIENIIKNYLKIPELEGDLNAYLEGKRSFMIEELNISDDKQEIPPDIILAVKKSLKINDKLEELGNFLNLLPADLLVQCKLENINSASNPIVKDAIKTNVIDKVQEKQDALRLEVERIKQEKLAREAQEKVAAEKSNAENKVKIDLLEKYWKHIHDNFTKKGITGDKLPKGVKSIYEALKCRRQGGKFKPDLLDDALNSVRKTANERLIARARKLPLFSSSHHYNEKSSALYKIIETDAEEQKIASELEAKARDPRNKGYR